MKASDRARILVVDDEERMCQSLESLLSRAGYQVRSAFDGKAALEEYREKHFDLVITDIKLPEMDGIQLLQEIRKDDPDAMVILMTAFASLDTALAAINMGAYDYLMKPIEFTQLRLATQRALEKRELQLARQKLLRELEEKNVQLNRRIAEVDALYQAGLTLSQSTNLESLLTKIIELALDVIQANVGSVMLLDERRGELTVAAAVGMSENLRTSTRVKMGSSIAGWVAQRGEPLLVKDIDTDPRFSARKEGKYESRSLLSAPLRIKERMLGVINLSDPRHGVYFEENDLRLLITFAAQAAIAIDDTENFQKVKEKLGELSMLYNIASELANVDSSKEMTDLIQGSLRVIMDVDFTVWLTWAERSETLVFNYWEGVGKAEAGRLMGREISLKEKTIYSSAARASAIKQEIESISGFKDKVRTLTAVPIISKGALHGVFCLGSERENAFSENDEYIASIVASQATSIYERQQAILNATRLVTMGKMMSEISHDLKKPLTNIRGSLQIMRERWPEITQHDDFFATAEQELLRLNELVRELVDFSNPKKYQLDQRRISDLVTRVERLVTNDLKKHNISFEQSFGNDLPPVMINENEMVELLLNLILNAIDAMPDGGKLSIIADRVNYSDRPVSFLQLRVEDTGHGISPEIRTKIFDRYFTTKESGTGLGLSICERIVMAHNGTISCESKVGQGTTFSITLPIT